MSTLSKPPDIKELTVRAANTSGLFRLDGRKAIVVGGSRGLGQAMALALAAAGADVCIAARGEEAARATATAVEELGRRAMALSVDVTHADEVDGLFDKVVSTWGRVDIVVNSQGAVHLEPTISFSMEEWQRVIDVNLKSVVLCCRAAGRHMVESGYGRIINISSVRGFQGRAGDPAYAPSKGAVNQLTRSLAIEWGPKGVTVNAIAPVFTLTAISAPVLEDEEIRNWVLSRIPMKRLGQLEDYFGPVVFLASAASSFVTGHVLPVDGGWLSA